MVTLVGDKSKIPLEVENGVLSFLWSLKALRTRGDGMHVARKGG